MLIAPDCESQRFSKLEFYRGKCTFGISVMSHNVDSPTVMTHNVDSPTVMTHNGDRLTGMTHNFDGEAPV